MNKLLVTFFNNAMYSSIFFVLFIVDFILGNGLVDVFQRLFCKIACFVKKTIREEAKVEISLLEQPVNLPVLFAEIFVLAFTVVMLNKYRQFRGTDRIDELLHDSKDALRETNEFLEKWRLRRINWQPPSNVYSYLDDEPQEIKPLKLEIPILHMAIIDTLGTSRSQPERGDAGDTFSMTDSAVLSILDEDMDYPEPVTQSSTEKILNYDSRYLWDVQEEDDNNLEEM